MSDLREKWRVLGEEYPEVVEMLLGEIGMAQPIWKSSLSSDEEEVLEFVREHFVGEPGTGVEDEVFQAFQEEKEGELGEESELLDREYFFECLDGCVDAGYLDRLPTGEDGFYYTSTLHCLLVLEEEGETDDVELDQLYRLAERTGVPVQRFVREAIDHPRGSLAVPDTEKGSRENEE